MAESLGARLRQQRERQQIALASIAEQTKISLSLLEGLERDDLLRWPTGIFRRAFVRAYAHAIGLEPDSVVREFLELHPDPVEVVATAASAPPTTGEEPVGQGPPTRLRWLIDQGDWFASPPSSSAESHWVRNPLSRARRPSTAIRRRRPLHPSPTLQPPRVYRP